MNPYGWTKLTIERILDDVAVARPSFAAISLRYFNPVGAHPSGLIGENPRDVPNNLFPYVAQTAAGRWSRLRVFGNDYPTPDGTGLRDYIHVVDLARGHVAAVERLLASGGSGHRRYNLGTRHPVSVLEAVAAFSAASGCPVPARSRRVARATWRPPSPIPPGPAPSSAGGPSWISSACEVVPAFRTGG